MRRVFPASCCCFVRACFLLNLLLKQEFVNDSDLIPAETHVTVCECLRSSAPSARSQMLRYFLLNAVTYGPVLYLLSAMQLSL